MSAAAVREVLRDCFEVWGLPRAIRVDNGTPWATQTDIPSSLALWLRGLGIRVILNRPRQSTDNAIVERHHGVMAQWVEAEKSANWHDLQTRLNEMIQMQRERYPIRDGLSRKYLHPTLTQTDRPYCRDNEAHLWQFSNVQIWFSQQMWFRRVDKAGQVSFFSQALGVGRAYTRQTLTIQYDPQGDNWIIQTEKGDILKVYPNQIVTPEHILNLALAKRAN